MSSQQPIRFDLVAHLRDQIHADAEGFAEGRLEAAVGRLLAKAKASPVRVDCSWCKSYLRGPLTGPVSHGICEPCAAVFTRGIAACKRCGHEANAKPGAPCERSSCPGIYA